VHSGRIGTRTPGKTKLFAANTPAGGVAKTTFLDVELPPTDKFKTRAKAVADWPSETLNRLQIIERENLLEKK